jgi:N-methylhydantoinase A
MTGQARRYQLGCDIGGTFTDFYLISLDTGEIWQEKELTTPDNPVDGVMQGLKKLEAKAGPFIPELMDFIHGTTLVINAVIERKGAKTGLITTQGFRDILEIRREERYDHYDLAPKMPSPLVPRSLRKEVKERTTAKGSILVELDPNQLQAIREELVAQKIESVAVCLLHSYINPQNERVIKDFFKEWEPDLYISLSSEVVPKIKEYERTTTTVVNAYTKPKINQYLMELMERVSSLGYKKRIHVMMSGGGITSLENARTFPVRIIESGPVGGVIAAELYGKTKVIPNLIAFDMGGTTAKLCLIKDYRAGKVDGTEIDRADRFKRGSGIPLEVPFVDLAEIGAGGGSIAWVNDYGLLQVGPESTGAKPGPACYERGGNKPTVTDADLALGYLNETYFLGGEMPISLRRAEETIRQSIAEKLGLPFIQAAYGIHDIVNENMANAARVHAIEKSYDPSLFSLVAFGGAGPVHAYGVARKLKSPQILIPNSAGVESAFGFLNAPLSFDLVQTYKKGLREADFSAIEALFKKIEEKAAEMLAGESSQSIFFRRSADMSYLGQGYEINISIPPGMQLNQEKLLALFGERYRFLYGQTYDEVEVGIANLKVEAIIPQEERPLPKRPPGGALPQAIKGRRKAFCIDRNEVVDFTVYDRYRLAPEAEFKGPAIIEERESTTVVGSQGVVKVDEYGVILIALR